MKGIINVIASLLIITLVGCKTEKPIASNNSKVFFEEKPLLFNQKPSSTPFGITSNSSAEKSEMLKEMVENKLPMSNPLDRFPTWQSYNELYNSKVKNLSPLTQQFCSQLFLSTYLKNTESANPELLEAVESYVTILVSNKYTGYELLYKTLLWLKTNGNNNFVASIKNDVSKYGKPTYIEKKNDQPNDERVMKNEELKKYLDEVIRKQKENQQYLIQIQQL